MAVSGVTDLAGRVLAGRYRLLAPIGTGASGRVYRAEDARLKRTVAVKVLHSALAEDAGFLKRFRAEAQVAASLQHPHVMTVHDWGEDEMPFMVLELLEGGSLRAMLDEDHRLSAAQAAHVGADVASALDYAHSRGIVHRDIKPANLLFDEHGIVRVADFGLARALAEASWTEPLGAVLGTVRYSSPEQAQGVPLDARSDLYSLALVLVEATTGRVPFASDTTIGTLAARTQRPLIAPDELGPLKAVIDRAGRIDPQERYPDPATMVEALADAAEALPRATPLILAGASEGADLDPTRAVAATGHLFDQDAEQGLAGFSDDQQPGSRPAAGSRRARGWGRRLVPWFVAVAIIAAAVAALVAFAGAGGTVAAAAPGLVGFDEATASLLAEDSGFTLEIADRVDSIEPAGTVLSQDPDSGEWSTASDVRVVVSSGPTPVVVPDVVGVPVDAALSALTAEGLLVDISRAYDDVVPANAIVAQEPPAGEGVAPESRVAIVVSDGPAPVPVPDVAGGDPDETRAELEALAFTTVTVEEFSSDVAEGLVVGTDPAAGVEAAFGSEITVIVSLGPELIVVPNVVGDAIEDASAELEGAGFAVEVAGPYQPGAPVATQSPAGGNEVERGSTITVSLGG